MFETRFATASNLAFPPFITTSAFASNLVPFGKRLSSSFATTALFTMPFLTLNLAVPLRFFGSSPLRFTVPSITASA